jgi:peptide-methionine (S)-S-oxide reductase
MGPHRLRGRTGRRIAAPAVDEPAGTEHTATAIFAGGCFWGVQGVFQHVKGVTSAVSGYTGGAARTANYESVEPATPAMRIGEDHLRSAQVSYGSCCRCSSRWRTTRPSSTARGRTRHAIPLGDLPANCPQRRGGKYIAQLDASHAYKEAAGDRIETGKKFYTAESTTRTT